MTNFEKYKDELINVLMEKMAVGEDGKIRDCDDTSCRCCIFNEKGNCRTAIKDWLCEEHKEPIKLKRWEYDLLKYLVYDNHSPRFNEEAVLMYLKENNNFKSIQDKSVPIGKILDNCIIVADDHKLLDSEVE